MPQQTGSTPEVRRRRQITQQKRKQRLRRYLLRRLVLLGVLIIVIVSAVLLFRKGDDPKPSPSRSAAGTGETAASEAPKDTAAETVTVPDSQPVVGPTAPPETEPEKAPEVTLIALGDNLIHSAVYESGEQADGSYDFRSMYDPIRDTVQAADIACINQETIFVNDPAMYSNYPIFGGPTAVGDALADAGFDVITQATNHCYDKFFLGIQQTLEFWRKYPQITVLGIHESQEDADTIRVVEKNGIRIAMLNYTYGTNMGLPEKAYMIDILDRTKMAADIEKAKSMADAVLVFAHWGTEDTFVPDATQRELGQFFADRGVTAVIGGHPHTLQPVEMLESADGNRMPIFWSLGNFISHMLHNQNMLGGMARLTLRRESDGRVVVSAYALEPTMTYGSEASGKWVFSGMLLKDYSDERYTDHFVEHTTTAEMNALYERIVEGTDTAWSADEEERKTDEP